MIRIENVRKILRLLGHKSLALGLCVFCLTVLFRYPSPAGAEEVDRLVAAVNGVAITEGDLNLARSLNAIVFFGKNAAATSRKEELERQINQELMRQELKNFSMADEQGKIEARLQSLRDAYAVKGGLAALLQRLGLQESELVSYMRLESAILRFVDFRFRPFINVPAEEVQVYYINTLTPQLQKSGIERPPLLQVSDKIEAILREEKINDVLDQWIKEIKRNSRIEYFDETEWSELPVASTPGEQR